jgi:hypothetical protein
MGLRYTLRLYKGCTAERLEHYLLLAAHQLGGEIAWTQHGAGNQDLRTVSNGDVYSLYIPYQWTDSIYCQAVGKLAGIPWIELRIQEGSLWDYTLWRGAEMLDTFSVCPQYWEGLDAPEDFVRERQGKPHVLADAWNIPVDRIERYLMHWGYADDPNDESTFQYTRTGLAYPDDQHPYGDYEQFFDVLRRLGGSEPLERHTIVLPTREEYLATQTGAS